VFAPTTPKQGRRHFDFCVFWWHRRWRFLGAFIPTVHYLCFLAYEHDFWGGELLVRANARRICAVVKKWSKATILLYNAALQ
jgi:hypothetical protein